MAEDLVDPPHPFGPGNPPVNADVPADPEPDEPEEDDDEDGEGV